MAKAIAINMRNGFMTVVEKPSLSEAVDQLYNVMRLNGWTGTREEIVPDREIRSGIFAYRVESSEEDKLVHVRLVLLASRRPPGRNGVPIGLRSDPRPQGAGEGLPGLPDEAGGRAR